LGIGVLRVTGKAEVLRAAPAPVSQKSLCSISCLVIYISLKIEIICGMSWTWWHETTCDYRNDDANWFVCICICPFWLEDLVARLTVTPVTFDFCAENLFTNTIVVISLNTGHQLFLTFAAQTQSNKVKFILNLKY
jgi:hypothetical protein